MAEWVWLTCFADVYTTMEPEAETGGTKMSSKSSSVLPDSPLYKRMTVVMHSVIFLYSTAFWIQVGVLPVSCLLTSLTVVC